MLDYDREATRYDRTRGGAPRAEEFAESIAKLLPAGVRTVLDIAGGTGLLASRLAVRGLDVVVCDRSSGMLALATGRRPGRAVVGDAARLPVGTGSVDVSLTVWLLHLLADAAPVVAECARVLRPGGIFVTTVDKATSHPADDDLAQVLASHREADRRPPPADARARIESLARAHGLAPYAEGRAVGYGQERTPESLAKEVEERARRLAPGSTGAAQRARAQRLAQDLRALPGPHRPRRPPVYTLLAFTKVGAGAESR